MQKIESEPKDVTARLLNVFKRLIAEGTLPPGGRLPAERDLATRFGVSRSSLRQALKVLDLMGVISQRVGDGTYLNSGADSILGEPMAFLILLDGIAFHELMETRLIVEPEIAARAALRATDEDIANLQEELAAMSEHAIEHRSLIEHDLRFHQGIFRAAGNRLCTQMFGAVHKSLEKFVALTATLVEPEHTVKFHRRIYTAIRRRDANEARQRMTEHLVDAQNLLTRAVEENSRIGLQQRIQVLQTQKKRTSIKRT